MAHFTYQDIKDPQILTQGDVLQKTGEIQKILREIHPYYLRDDYTHFIVLTQSCDLIRRQNNRCKSKYITIAAVKPFDLFLSREILKFQYSDYEKKGKLCRKDRRDDVYRLLERIFNNNEPEYLFLHEDITHGLNENHIAFLKLSVALKSELHYETCLKARILELLPEFKAKLGWLTGNMYSRVGTTDWVPDIKEEPDFQTMLNELLDKKYIWIDEKHLNYLKDKITEIDFVNKSSEEKLEIIKKNKPKSGKERFITSLSELLFTQTNIPMARQQCEALIRIIISDPTIKAVIK